MKKLFMFLLLGMFMISFGSATYCYQESANTINQSSVDGNCGLDYSGSYIQAIQSGSGFYNATNVYGITQMNDGNWGSYIELGLSISNISINYTKPLHVINASWNFYRGWDGNYINNNITILQSCLEMDNLQIKIYTQSFIGSAIIKSYCLNASGWNELSSMEHGTSMGPRPRIYEEAIYWDIDLIPPTITLVSPLNESTYNSSWENISIEFTASDANIDSCWYNIGGDNISTTCNDSISYLVLDNENLITYYANDTLGNDAKAVLSITGGIFLVNISNSTYGIELLNGSSSWEEGANLTFNSSSPSTSWFDWLIGGVSQLAGWGESVFNYVFNLPSESPNATVILNTGRDAHETDAEIGYNLVGYKVGSSNTYCLSTADGTLYQSDETKAVDEDWSTGMFISNSGTWSYNVSLYENFTTESTAGSIKYKGQTCGSADWIYNVSCYDGSNWIFIDNAPSGSAAYSPNYTAEIPSDCLDSATTQIKTLMQIPSGLRTGGVSVWETAILWNATEALTSESFEIVTNSINPLLTASINASTIYTVGDKILLNTTVTDANIDTCWYNYNSINTTIAGCVSGTQNQTEITTVAGQTDITVYVNDSVGNMNSTTLSFIYDAVAPSINITAPSETSSSIIIGDDETLNYSISDDNLDSCWLSYYEEDSDYSADFSTDFVDGDWSTSSGFPSGNITYTIPEGVENATWLYNYFWGSSVLADTSGVNNTYDLSSCMSGETEIVLKFNQTGGNNTIYCNGDEVYNFETAGKICAGSCLYTWYEQVIEWGYYNTSINCSETSYDFSYINNLNELTVYANDTMGNENSETTTWDYNLVFVSQSYESPVYETSSSAFSTNVSYTSSDWSSAAGYLIYDDDSYVATSTGSVDNFVFSRNITAPAVSNETNVTFYWLIQLTNATGAYNFTSDETNQTVSKVSFALCNLSANPQIVFNTYSTLSPTEEVNATFASAWTIKDADGGSEVLTRSFEDLNENVSTWAFCIGPNTTTYTVSADVTVDAANYTPTTHFIVDTDYSGEQNNISLFLLDDDDSTLTQIVTTDLDNSPVQYVYTYIQRYDLGTDTYYTVGITRSDSAGEDLVYLSWYDDWYKFIGVYEGEVVFTDGPKKISESPQTFKFGDLETLHYQQFDNILYSLTYNNATQNFILTYVDPSGFTTSNCLRVIKRNAMEDLIICDTCETSSSATIYCNVAGAGNGTFVADYYATGSPRNFIDFIVEGINIQTKIYDLIGNDNGTGIALIIAGIVLALFLITPAMGIMGAIFGVLLGMFLGFQPFDYLAMGGLIVVGVAMMWAVQK